MSIRYGESPGGHQLQLDDGPMLSGGTGIAPTGLVPQVESSRRDQRSRLADEPRPAAKSGQSYRVRTAEADMVRAWAGTMGAMLVVGSATAALAGDAEDCISKTIPADRSAAACRRLAEDGNAVAQYNLGVMYLSLPRTTSARMNGAGRRNAATDATPHGSARVGPTGYPCSRTSACEANCSTRHSRVAHCADGAHRR
jgi:hypothetical protein